MKKSVFRLMMLMHRCHALQCGLQVRRYASPSSGIDNIGNTPTHNIFDGYAEPRGVGLVDKAVALPEIDVTGPANTSCAVRSMGFC